jgi:glyoxylase I family protein
VPDICGQVVVLTVSDAARSARWYCDLFDFTEIGRYEDAHDRGLQVGLGHAGSGMQLYLVQHGIEATSFDERRSGLDHLEFIVPRRSDLDVWCARLDSLGIAHSGIKEPTYTTNAMITFRDPDNIQLEFFWPSGQAGGTK